MSGLFRRLSSRRSNGPEGAQPPAEAEPGAADAPAKAPAEPRGHQSLLVDPAAPTRVLREDEAATRVERQDDAAGGESGAASGRPEAEHDVALGADEARGGAHGARTGGPQADAAGREGDAVGEERFQARARGADAASRTGEETPSGADAANRTGAGAPGGPDAAGGLPADAGTDAAGRRAADADGPHPPTTLHPVVRLHEVRPEPGEPYPAVPAAGGPMLPVSDLPAGVDPDELAAAPPTSARRSRLRRRVSYLRAAREVLLRDLGGFVYELHRTAGDIEHEAHRRLREVKLSRLSRLDAELHELEVRLDDVRRHVVVREPGVGGECPHCSELFGSDAHYCAHCGLPLTDSARRAVAHEAARPEPVATVPEPVPPPDHPTEEYSPLGDAETEFRWPSRAGVTEGHESPAAGDDTTAREAAGAGAEPAIRETGSGDDDATASNPGDAGEETAMRGNAGVSGAATGGEDTRSVGEGATADGSDTMSEFGTGREEARRVDGGSTAVGGAGVSGAATGREEAGSVDGGSTAGGGAGVSGAATGRDEAVSAGEGSTGGEPGSQGGTVAGGAAESSQGEELPGAGGRSAPGGVPTGDAAADGPAAVDHAAEGAARNGRDESALSPMERRR